MILIVLLILTVNATVVPLSECGEGRATFYDTYASEQVACMLGNDYPSDIYRVAPSEQFYLGSAQCGICYEVVGEIGSAVVMVSDLCPAKGNEGNCDSDITHFDLGENVFPLVCNKPTGVCNITYRMVACNVVGNVKVLLASGSSKYWMGLYIRNYKVGLKGVSISFGSVTRELTRENHNAWNYQTQSGEVIETPVTVTVTSIAGDTTTITLNDIVENKVYEGNGQFSIPEKTYFKPTTLDKINAPGSTDECCSLPENSVIYHDNIETFWNVGYGTYTNDQSEKKEGSASMKFTWEQWGGMNIGTAQHFMVKSMYTGIQFYVKSSSAASINLWHLNNDGKKKTVETSTEWKSVTVSFDELAFSNEYFEGFEVQSTTAGSVDFYFDEIKLVKKEDVCFQFCSDHTSTCSTISPGDANEPSNPNEPSQPGDNTNQTTDASSHLNILLGIFVMCSLLLMF